LVRIFERYVTKFAAHAALELILWGKLTLDERVVLHRVVHETISEGEASAGLGLDARPHLALRTRHTLEPLTWHKGHWPGA